MKTISINGLFAIAFLLLISGCSLQTHKEGNLSFKSIEKTDSIYLLNDKTAPYAELKINIEYPIKGDKELKEWVTSQISQHVLGEKYANIAPETAIEQYTQRYDEEYINNVEELYKEELEVVEDAEQVGVWYYYTHSNSGEVTYYNKSVLTYEANVHEFTGGAHGNYAINYLNLDLVNKTKIELHQLFSDGYELDLTDIIKNQIKIDNKAEDLNDAGFWEDNIIPTENFKLDDKAITFLYNTYEIAPYSMGDQAVTVSYEKIKDWLNLDNPIVKELLNIE